MGKRLAYVCTVFILFTALLPRDFLFAKETIPSFEVTITVFENATIEVTERIEYDFSERQRHGIFRRIPYSYQAGAKTYTADIVSVLVTDEHGAPRPFVESRGNGELELKIGDPNVTISGVHVYVISYIVAGPFLYFDRHDELYWNATGYWSESIGNATVLLNLPRGATVLDASCYRGQDGSTMPCDEDKKLVGVEQAGYVAGAMNLMPEEGLTVAVAFPKGVIARADVPWKDPVTRRDLFPLGIPLLTLFFMATLWYTRGRDPKRASAIVTEFTPPLGLSASLAGVVKSEHVSPKSIAAEIIALAAEGYIKIHRTDDKVLVFTVTDYIFERKGDTVPEDPIRAFILEKLFQEKYLESGEVTGVRLSKMKNNFSSEKKEITDFIYEESYLQGFFMGRPDSVRNLYMALGVGSALIGGIVAVTLGDTVVGVMGGISIVLSGLLVFLFGNRMPARTKEGVRVRDHLLGFKRYLKTAEKDRIRYHDSPQKYEGAQKKTVEIFSMYLPYAMVFGVEKEWVGQFEGIFEKEPSWYSGARAGAFTPMHFVEDLKHFTGEFNTAMAPTGSGAGGHGSVGGGFGGGRGGSW